MLSWSVYFFAVMFGIWWFLWVSVVFTFQLQLWSSFSWWESFSEPVLLAERSPIPSQKKDFLPPLSSQKAKKSDPQEEALASDEEEYEEIILTDEFDFLEE